MLREQEVHQVIIRTLEELRLTIDAGNKERYTKEELLDLLTKVSAIMTSM